MVGLWMRPILPNVFQWFDLYVNCVAAIFLLSFSISCTSWPSSSNSLATFETDESSWASYKLLTTYFFLFALTNFLSVIWNLLESSPCFYFIINLYSSIFLFILSLLLSMRLCNRLEILLFESKSMDFMFLMLESAKEVPFLFRMVYKLRFSSSCTWAMLRPMVFVLLFWRISLSRRWTHFPCSSLRSKYTWI